jgi:hypothetical protein
LVAAAETVTLLSTVLLQAVALMVAVPGLLAVTTPALLTVATAVLLLDQTTGHFVFDDFALSVADAAPTVNERAVLSMVNVVVSAVSAVTAAVTVTLLSAVLLQAVALMVAVPGFIGVTTPVLFTVATAVLLLDQTTGHFVFDDFAVSVAVAAPTVNERAVLSMVNVVVSAVGCAVLESCALADVMLAASMRSVAIIVLKKFVLVIFLKNLFN